VTGFSDVSLSGSGSSPAYADWGVQRVSSNSMPLPTQFPEPGSTGSFWGDYAGLSAVDNAYPLWSDTRDPDLFACPSATSGSGFAQPPAVCGGALTLSPPAGSGGDTSYVANDQNIYVAANSVPSK
jgi:hypothetical protein